MLIGIKLKVNMKGKTQCLEISDEAGSDFDSLCCLYDPVVGRFLNPDNFVQDPANTQSYNRYSYCLNNPLKYTDPSGEAFEWLIWAGIQVANYAINFANNKKQNNLTTNEAFSSTPIVASINFSPSDGSFSNYQVDANRTAQYANFLSNDIDQKWSDHLIYGSSYQPNYEMQVPSLCYGGGESWLSKAWNSDIARSYIPDVISVSGSGVLTFLGGGGAEVGLALPLRGQDAGKVYLYGTLKGKVGLHGGVSVNIGQSNYLGPVNLFDFDATFRGKSSGIEGDYFFGAGISVSELDRYGNSLLSIDLGVGPGIGGSGNIGAITYTYPWFRIWK
jgi:RHS repeat-associated protein